MKTDKKLSGWQEKLENARIAYSKESSMFDIRDKYYNGTRDVYKDAKSGSLAAAKSTNVRNIVYELIESQVDSNIPMPRVEAVHEEDKDLAKTLEAMLRNVVKQKNLDVVNDMQERTVPIQGGTFWHVEWDSKGGTHCVLGDVVISDRHPKQFIPQPGVNDMRDMDYMFLQLSQTKEYIKRRYGIDVEAQTEDHPEARAVDEDAGTVDGLVTQNIVYYRNEGGGIGMYSWVNDQVLADYDDCQARRLERCKKCGAIRTGEVCEECGSKSFQEYSEDFEEIITPIRLHDGRIITPGNSEEVQVDLEGNPLKDDMTGEVIVMPETKATKIPYYKPNAFPIILRKNVSKFGSLLGGSDVDMIADQQEAIKKFGSKIDEKILKGGSFVTLPEGVSIDTSDTELKVIRVKDPSQKSLIGVINVQPDVSKEMAALSQNYDYAKSTLGITDSFQGKYDSSATSGTAKQFAANQSAGRLQSKRNVKNKAYGELYKLIFQFMLAYSDQKIPITQQMPDGNISFDHFDRYDFLRMDDDNVFYWDDEFIFSVDPSSTTSSNRETLWSQIDMKLQSGAFGPLGDMQTILRYWTMMANLSYPNAEQIKKSIMETMQQQSGGEQNALPVL